jgi:DNA-binding NarL/FixJ family response regulator
VTPPTAAGCLGETVRAEAAPGRPLVRIPYGTLAQLLTATPPAHGHSSAPPPALTARQAAVLGLMAEGDGNAVIARTLRCSEHTVKNVIYELMGRLQARNRAHAVAYGVRCGLI